MKRSDISVAAVFDIETSDWTQFVVGGMQHADGRYYEFGWHDEETFVNELLDVAGDVWSHNGGAFDIKWLLDHCIKRGLSPAIASAGARIVSMRVGKARFLDSKALSKLTLKEFTDGLGVMKQRLGIPCIHKPDCDSECQGYCAISRDMYPQLYKRLTTYLQADCESLYLALMRLKEFAATNDLDLSITVGASAWKCAKRWLDLPTAQLSPADHEFMRRTYFGGRVQLFRPESESGRECDVNSMYPSRLRECAVPLSEPERRQGRLARLAYDAGCEGAYCATVNVPESHLPPLPFRTKNRVAYPWGEFCGAWTRPELAYAESLGVKILEMDEALVFPDSGIVFAEWVDRMFSLRMAAPGGKSGPLGTFIKYDLNSFTGKLGSRPDHEKVVVNPDEIIVCPGGYCCDACEWGDCCRECGAFIPLSETSPIYSVSEWRLAACAHVEWASYLTSEARIEWHKQATSIDLGWDMVYGDTDSCFSESPRTRRMGKECGEWEDKGAYSNFRGIAPKLYSFERAKETIVKAKGLRLPKDGKQALAAIQPGAPLVGKAGVIGFRRGARQGTFFIANTLSRRVGRGFGDRILGPGQNVTRAPRIIDGRLEA